MPAFAFAGVRAFVGDTRFVVIKDAAPVGRSRRICSLRAKGHNDAKNSETSVITVSRRLRRENHRGASLTLLSQIGEIVGQGDSGDLNNLRPEVVKQYTTAQKKASWRATYLLM